MLKIKDLNKSYGKFKALDNLNLDIEKGELFGFVGIQFYGIIKAKTPKENGYALEGKNCGRIKKRICRGS